MDVCIRVSLFFFVRYESKRNQSGIQDRPFVFMESNAMHHYPLFTSRFPIQHGRMQLVWCIGGWARCDVTPWDGKWSNEWSCSAWYFSRLEKRVTACIFSPTCKEKRSVPCRELDQMNWTFTQSLNLKWQTWSNCLAHRRSDREMMKGKFNITIWMNSMGRTDNYFDNPTKTWM